MLRNDLEYRKELVLQQKAGGTAGVKKPCESRKQWDLGAKVEELVYSWFAGDLPALGTEGPAPHGTSHEANYLWALQVALPLAGCCSSFTHILKCHFLNVSLTTQN